MKRLCILSLFMAFLLMGCNGGKPSGADAGKPVSAADTLQAAADTAANASTQTVAVKTKEQLAEDVAARVREIYDAVIETYTPDATGADLSKARLDERFCSDDWLAALHAVMEKDEGLDGEIGFFEADYWVMGQDFQDLKAENIKVVSLSPDEGKATATLDWHNCGNVTKVMVSLVFEHDEWKIDELTDRTHGDTGWKADMKAYASDNPTL